MAYIKDWVRDLNRSEKRVILHVMINISKYCTSDECKNYYIDKIAKHFELTGELTEVLQISPKSIETVFRISERAREVLYKFICFYLIQPLDDNNPTKAWEYIMQIVHIYNLFDFKYEPIRLDILNNQSYELRNTYKPIKTEQTLPLIFLHEDVRLAILHYMIEAYNRYANSEKCRNFSFLEEISKTFDMHDRLGDAAYLDDFTAQSIILGEKHEVIRFTKSLIGYLLSNDKWTLDKSGNIDDDPNAYINNILGELSYISRETHNPCLDFQIKNLNVIKKTSIVEEALSPKTEVKTNNNSTLNTPKKSNPKVDVPKDVFNEIFYKDL